jgi:iodotyrosine deiodinase
MSDTGHHPVPLGFHRLPEDEMQRRASAFYSDMRARRSVRSFSPDPVPRELVELALATAHSAPSGANRQPWHFVAISDREVKRRIWEAAEEEEREFYQGGRTPDVWLEALEPLGTGWRKPFLGTAPWLVTVFKEVHGLDSEGGKIANYYVNESVGIACGLFIAALHRMGLVTLTHTPQPMRFLNRILDRPANERPFILFPIGYPAEGCTVPLIEKKPLAEVVTWMEASPHPPGKRETGNGRR